MGFFNNRRLLAFVHIEKTAGTTLMRLFRRNLFMRFMEVRPLSKSSNRFFRGGDLRKTLFINPFTKLIAGHSISPVILDNESSTNSISYLTLLREPVRRYASHYSFWIKQMGHRLSFEDFLLIEELSNFQTKKIANSEDFEAAKKLLNTRFLVVGLTESFDEFLVLLKKTMMPLKFDTRYQLHNVSPNKIFIDRIIEKYYDRILEKNIIDLKLYDYVKNTLIAKQRESYGSIFNRDLSKHKENSQLISNIKFERLDYKMRVFFEIFTGIIRKINGLPAKGSY